MATIRFYTRSKLNKLVTIWLRFIDGENTDIRIPTPYKIFPDYWNEDKQVLRQRILYSDVFTEAEAKNIEDKFSQLKDVIFREYFNLPGPATRDWLSVIIHKFYYKKAPGAESLNQYIQRFIDEASSGKRIHRGKKYNYSTIKNYKGFQAQFDDYQQERGKKLSFDDITIDFYKDFIGFFNNKKYSPNTIGRHIKHLKVLMRQSGEEGLHNNSEYQRKSFEAMQEPVDSIYLNEDELKILFELDLPEKHLEIARDVFLCGCYTAQRYSDYSKICKDNIKTYSGNKVIELIQQKMGEKCIIPIRLELNHILSKYDYNLPRTHEQKINKYIKDIARKAKITDMIQYEENKGGMRIKKSVAKCDLIKTHTARRSGCTNMYLAGIHVIDIMKISGHKTEREFLKYIRVTKEQTAISLSSHPYFVGNTLSVI